MPLISLIIGLVILIVALIVVAIVYVIGQLLWSLLCVVAVNCTRPKGKRALWIALTVPLFIPFYVASVSWLVWWQWPDKYTAYEVAFDTTVSPTVKIYSGNVSGWGDWEEIELHFNATPKDIQQITARGLTLMPRQTALPNQYNTPAASLIPLAGKDVYVGGSPNQRFSSVDEALLIYDPLTGDAWYWYDGLD